jgi:hypothetical protein
VFRNRRTPNHFEFVLEDGRWKPRKAAARTWQPIDRP